MLLGCCFSVTDITQVILSEILDYLILLKYFSKMLDVYIDVSDFTKYCIDVQSYVYLTKYQLENK